LLYFYSIAETKQKKEFAKCKLHKMWISAITIFIFY